jgi:hypothetical protein
MPVITDIVANILARLEADGALPYCKAFEAIPARLTQRRDEISQAAIRALQNRAPFVLVAADEIGRIEGKTGGTTQEWRCELDIYVYCGTDHRAGMVAGRLDPDAAALADPNADPGLRQFLVDVFGRLAGWAPVSTGERLNPVRGTWALVDAAHTIWEWHLTTQLRLTSQPLPPRARYTTVRVDNQTPDDPPAIIASEELP